MGKVFRKHLTHLTHLTKILTYPLIVGIAITGVIVKGIPNENSRKVKEMSKKMFLCGTPIEKCDVCNSTKIDIKGNDHHDNNVTVFCTDCGAELKKMEYVVGTLVEEGTLIIGKPTIKVAS